MKNKNIHYGCAWSAPDNWDNYDASPTLRYERIPLLGRIYTKNDNRFPGNVKYGDIVKGLPLTNNSCDFVYCSHVLEHLSLNDCERALINTHRMMKKGGVSRLVLPDLEYCIKDYIENPKVSALEFMKSLDVGLEERPKTIISLLYSLLQNSKHYWMWDYVSLHNELKKAGFNNIRRAYFNDSSHKIFQDVEEYTRWENCLGIEAIK